jgi:hypothetical protein
MSTLRRPPYGNIRRATNKCNAIDLHEIQKKEIYSQRESNSNFNFPQNAKISQEENIPGDVTETRIISSLEEGKTGFEETGLYFDSIYQTGVSDSDSLTWSITNLNYNSENIKNCVQIKIFPFYFPTPQPINGIDFFYFKRIFIEILDLPSQQSYWANNNNRFHFEMMVTEATSQTMYLTPINDTYVFDRPINYLNEFKLNFYRNPSFDKVSFVPAIIIITSVIDPGTGFGYNPARFKLGLQTTDIIAAVGELPGLGVAVKISKHKSTSLTVDQQTNQDHFIKNILDSKVFEVETIDATALNGGTTCELFIFKNRIAITSRFTTVTRNNTNYLIPNYN